MTKLSVIILNHNTRKILSRCLEKLTTGLADLESEIIVVDNASTDGSPLMVKKNFPEAKLLELKENKGFSAGNNLGVQMAEGEYFAFLNSDVLVEKDTLNKLIDYLEEHPQVGILTPRLVLRDNQVDPDCHRGFPTPWAACTYFFGLEKLFPRSKIFGGYHQFYKPMSEIHQIDACCGALMVVRREVGEQIGWWDEEYFFYGEDLDFCYQAKEQGWQVVYNPQAQAVHFKGASSGLRKETGDLLVEKSTRIKAAKESVRAMEIFYNKFYKDKYPTLITGIVLLGIKLKGAVRILINYFKE